MITKNPVCLLVRRHIAMGGYNAIKIMINNEVPASPAEVAHLMELMSDIAVMIDDGTEEQVQLDLTNAKAVALWHSCNVTLVNDLAHNKMDKGFMMELMDLLAPKLDGEVDEDDTEDKAGCSPEQGSDDRVPNGKSGLSIVGSENTEES